MVCLCLSPRTHTFSCVPCRAAVVLPMQKGPCVGGGPLSYSCPCSLAGPTLLLVSVGGAGRASVVRVILALAPRPGICPHLFLLFFSLVAPLVCAVWHNMVTYLRGSLLPLLIVSCDACLVAVVLPIQMSVGGRGSFLLLSSSDRSWCTPLLCVHVCVLFSAVAQFSSLLRPAWFHTPLWLPLFVVLLACGAWHATYLRDSLLTRILSSVACLGAVVLPIQASVRGRGLFLLPSSLGQPWFTPSLSCSCVHTPLWCPLLVALPVCAAWHVTYLRGCNILTSPTSFRVSCGAAPLYSLCKWACGGGGFVMQWPLVIAFLCWSHTLALVWCVTYLCLLPALSSPISYRVVLVTAYFSIVWLSSPQFISYLHLTRLHTPL